jgi:hypothetical protein
MDNFSMSHSGKMGVHGPHARRSGSSKPKGKKNGSNQQPIKIIKNVNNNNFILNNPHIEIKNPQMIGGNVIHAQNYHPGMQKGHNSGVTVIKDNNIVMSGGIMASGSASGPTNMMVRRLADQG